MLAIILLPAIVLTALSVYDMPMESFQKMLCEKSNQEILANTNFHYVHHDVKDQDLPISFDARVGFAGCIHPVRNQGQCGSCWAHAASEALSDRYCIASKKSIDVILSPQYLVNCDTLDAGCDGGSGPTSFQFLEQTGTVLDTCMKYQAKNIQCGTTCDDGSAISASSMYKCAPGSVYIANDTNSIKVELMKNGPMYSRFDVYDDFKQYVSGIYYQTSKNFRGGHAVKLMGWGKQNGINYWIFQNSWGESWGENGFFRIKFGESGICAFAVGCQPVVN